MISSTTKFHEKRLIIDGETNEKHALLVECGQGRLDYNRPIIYKLFY